MASWVKVGAKCVCVDNSPSHHGSCDLVVGKVYVVTERVDTENGVGVNVEGSISKAYAYHAWRFRPIITKTQEQDIALFKHHLVEINAHTDA